MPFSHIPNLFSGQKSALWTAPSTADRAEGTGFGLGPSILVFL